MDRVHLSPSTPKRPFRLFPCGLLLTLLLLPLPEVSGQTLPDRIHDFLEDASGFQLLGDIQEVSLGQGEDLAIALPLLEGADYIVVAYCGDACTNLDLVLFDSAGGEVQADRLPDSQPVLMITAESTGVFYIHATVVECSMENCETAVGVLASTDEPGLVPGEDMEGRLTLVGTELMSLGFEEVGEENRGALLTDQAITVPLTLVGGMDYRVVGVCDMDCFDLDLALLDPDGMEAASDFLEDALPILAFVPDSTMDYQVEVIMVACAVEPCSFRIATFAKEKGDAAGRTTFSGEMVFQETIRGELESKDQQLSGAYLDIHEIEVRAGQRLIVDLRSEDFDTLLRVFRPDGVGDESDDYGLETNHSRIEILALADGVYSIQVTSFSPGSSGGYVLQIAVVE